MQVIRIIRQLYLIIEENIDAYISSLINKKENAEIKRNFRRGTYYTTRNLFHGA